MEYCVYKTDDDYRARMAVDILETNNIRTYCKNLGIQNLYGSSKLLTGTDLIVDEIMIFVKEEDAENAKQLIEEADFLKNKHETIENDSIKNDNYFSQRAFVFSAASLFIIPFFFNLEYIIYAFLNNKKSKYILLLANIIVFAFSLIICISSFEYVKYIWKGNLFFILAFSIGKGIELHKKKSKLTFLMFIPVILLIISYNIADQLFGIRLFGH